MMNARVEDYLNLDLMIIAIISKLFTELMGIISISTSDKMCQIEK